MPYETERSSECMGCSAGIKNGRGLYGMSEKSVQKKKYIVDTARKVFQEKGYKQVTMKDIVDACEISRGGLYLYFSSTADIFEEILRQEQEEEDSFGEEIPQEATAADVLALFLKEQKRDLLSKKNSLTIAIYEYFFENKVPEKQNYMKKQFDIALFVLESLITEGVENGEFYCEDPHGAASNMMYVLEGLRVAARTRGITEAVVDKEILYMMSGLIAEEE